MIIDYLFTVFETILIGVFFIAVSEIIISNSLEFLEKNQQLSTILRVLRRFIVSSCFVFAISIITLLGSALIIKINLVKEITLFNATIFISISTFLIYFFYMSRIIQTFFIHFQDKTASSITKWVLGILKSVSTKIYKYVAMNSLKKFSKNLTIETEEKKQIDMSYLAIINRSKKGELLLVISYLDSIVLVMTVLGLLLTTKITAPLNMDNSNNQIYMYIYILVFISIIIAKIHANHEKENLYNLEKVISKESEF